MTITKPRALAALIDTIIAELYPDGLAWASRNAATIEVVERIPRGEYEEAALAQAVRERVKTLSRKPQPNRKQGELFPVERGGELVNVPKSDLSANEHIAVILARVGTATPTAANTNDVIRHGLEKYPEIEDELRIGVSEYVAESLETVRIFRPELLLGGGKPPVALPGPDA